MLALFPFHFRLQGQNHNTPKTKLRKLPSARSVIWPKMTWMNEVTDDDVRRLVMKTRRGFISTTTYV
jgi:hypothetical protein